MVGSTQLNLSAIPSMLAAHALRAARARVETASVATGSKPAAVSSTESLRSTLAYLDAQTAANQRGMAIASTADATLGAVNDLLIEAKTLALANANDAGLSAEEKTANTIQITSALSAIDHLTTHAKFGDTNLFDGNYKLAAGGASLEIAKVSVESLNLSALKAGIDGDPMTSINNAIQSITTMRGKIGAFSHNTLESQLNAATQTRIEITAAVTQLAETAQAFKLSSDLRTQFLMAPEHHVKAVSHSAGNVLWLINPSTRLHAA